MPRIELIPEVFYQPNDPIHWEYDNLPLKNIIRRQNLINLALDNVITDMREAIGTQGSVANRLSQSINPDGSLKVEAIDEVLHSIEQHSDSDNYVRMSVAQSDKLDLIADEATNLVITFSDNTSEVTLDSGEVIFESSNTITTAFTSPNRIKFNLNFPTESAHRHYCGVTPYHANDITPDYINYTTPSPITSYMDGSLKVYVNGMRIFEDDDVYVPSANLTNAWTLLHFTADSTNGTLQLSEALNSSDIIKIDFDVSLV